MKPLINIITRSARNEKFLNTLNSINNQTYDNIRHIITYQTDDMFTFLNNIEYKYPTTFVRVPNKKKIKNLFMFFDIDDAHVDFSNFEWENYDCEIHVGNPHSFEINNRKHSKTEILRFERDGFWCTTLGRTVTKRVGHFPFNSFCKLAEREVNDGWIIYIDDDDRYTENESVQKLVNEIVRYDEDYLHLLKVIRHNTTIPSQHYFNYMKTGIPLIWGEISISGYCFHSKYKEFTYWDEWSAGDYRNAKVLEKIIPNKNFIDYAIVDASNIGLGKI